MFSIKYSAQAYECGKYAFVSDFARLQVLFEYGGFYLDTDVELIKPLDDLRDNEIFMGFESDIIINPGSILGAQSKNSFIGELIDKYSNLSFIYNGHLNLTTVGEYTTSLLLKKGLKLNGRYQKLDCITIYPQELFSPYSYGTGEMNITANTYSIHHYYASWKEHSGQETNHFKLKQIKLVTKLRLLSIIDNHKLLKIKYLLR